MNKSEREKFKNDILLKLALNNYGLPVDEHNRPLMIEVSSNKLKYIKDSDIVKLKAIKELKIRLNVWVELGREDIGTIDYPEAERKIEYQLVKNVKKCKINLLALQKGNRRKYIDY